MASSSDDISFSFEGVGDFQKYLDETIAKAGVATREFVAKGGLVIEASAKAHMDGRPGPNVQTGTLRRSVVVVDVTPLGPGTWQSRTGPTVIYGRRIELGFVGTDSLGRVYTKKAQYPYMKPGLKDAMPKLAVLWKELMEV